MIRKSQTLLNALLPPLTVFSDEEQADTEHLSDNDGHPFSPEQAFSYDAFIESNDLIQSPTRKNSFLSDEKTSAPLTGDNTQITTWHYSEEGQTACDQTTDIAGTQGTSPHAQLYYADQMLRHGDTQQIESTLEILSTLALSCPDNQDCREDLFEQKYFANLLMAIGLLKLNEPIKAEAALEAALTTSEEFRKNIRQNSDASDLMQRHFARLGKLLCYYLEDDDLALGRGSVLFMSIWNLRAIEATPANGLKTIIITSMDFSPTFFTSSTGRSALKMDKKQPPQPRITYKSAST